MKVRMQQRGGVWYVRAVIGGKERKVSTQVPVGRGSDFATSRDHARVIGIDKLAELAKKEGKDLVSARMPLSVALSRQFEDHWKATKSAHVLRYVLTRLIKDVGYWPIDEITYTRLKDYGDSLIRNEGLSPGTVRRRISMISTALRECARRGELLGGVPPMPKWKEPPPRERYLTPEEEEAAWSWMAGKVKAERHDPEGNGQWEYLEALVTFLLDTGFRISEALSLTPPQVVDGKAHLRHGTTKSDKGRVIPLTKRAQAAVARMFASPWHGKANNDWVAHRWNQVRKAVPSMKDVNIHVLRHTCASRLIQRGVPFYTVSKWLGHSSVKVTERYLHLDATPFESAVAALESPPIGSSQQGTTLTP